MSLSIVDSCTNLKLMWLLLACAGSLLFFALLGVSGCFITWYDPSVQDDLAQPCKELCICCCQSGYVIYLFGTIVRTYRTNFTLCRLKINLVILFIICTGSVSSLSTTICLVPFVHGLMSLAVLHASKVNVIAREVLVNPGYHY